MLGVILVALILWGRMKARLFGTPFGGPDDPRDSCPCQCGTSIGMSKRGFSIGAAQAMVLFVQAQEALGPVLADDIPEDERREHEKFLKNSYRLVEWYLEHVHGTAAPGRTPNGMELRKGLQVLQGDVNRLRTA